jgi:hypothetical protein
MATTVTDKKKLFQIQTVQSKLDNYKQTLKTLLESHKQLSDNLELNNPNYDNLDKLNNNRIVLENTLKEIKSNIAKTTNNITKLSYSLKELPSIRINKYNEEEIILKQEIDRIELQKLEDKEKYDKSIEKAHLDKLKLIDDISIIQNAIQEQNNIILQIQTNTHSSRKDTLLQLHQKKEKKNNIKEQIDNNYIIDNLVNNQITELKNTIKKLEEFKIILVDKIYNTDTDTDTNTNTNNNYNDTLENYNVDFNIDKELLLNDKINIIDTKINDLQKKINNITTKLNKNNTSNTSRINSIIDNYNKTTREKVIAYKDNFKIEKEKKKQLQLILDTLNYQYDTFEKNIIANINLNSTNAINELHFDIIRANERLIIMKYRINLEYETETNRIKDEISILNINIIELSKTYFNTNKELQNLQITIDKENSVGKDIAKLNEEIQKYKAMIMQNETNIMLLSQ